MRRRTRRALLNIVLFGGALCLIIYLNRQQPDKPYAWTTIRYRTRSTSLPEARGLCPGLGSSSKPALVVSRVSSDGDTKWLDPLASKYHHCVYTADAPADVHSTHLQVPANRGHEAMGYLTFLIDNYDEIPAAGAVFVHGSRWAWHNDAPDYDNAALLAALNISAALDLWGYHNLRCDWSASTCSASTAPPQGSWETSLNAMLQPWDARAVSDAALPGAFATLFGGDKTAARMNAVANDEISLMAGERILLGAAEAIRAQCCAQFVVARRRIWQHTRAEYVALRQWLLDKDVAPRDDRVAGRILSYLWHILFMLPEGSDAQDLSHGVFKGIDLEHLNTQACPRADDCYCRLYGRCGLGTCTGPGHCSGQYILPPDFKLPKDWAITHS